MKMSNKSSTILAIETSCDETAVSVVRYGKNGLEVLSTEISSQVKLHAKWGGVVPNLAAREHVRNMPHIFKNALGEAGILPSQIDAIAITNGPGLIPALLVGTGTAKTLSYLWQKPLLGIHHIEGHIYANFIGNSKIKFPILCLVVSGGHTQLVLMRDHFKYEIVGQTLDDAAGEAFDKVARIMDIGYPGGPAVSKHAEIFKKLKDNKARSYKIVLPRPMMNKKNFDFSFSGLKTAVLYETKKHPELLKDKKYISALCHEFQQAVVDVLLSKTIKAAEQFKPKTIMLAGGVSANKELRKQLGEAIKNNLPEISYVIPDLSLTGDNAAMIGAAAALRWQKMSDSQKKKTLSGWKTINTDANLRLAK
jgi:N6-L-threonylcarbamoyladenine synthase